MLKSNLAARVGGAHVLSAAEDLMLLGCRGSQMQVMSACRCLLSASYADTHHSTALLFEVTQTRKQGLATPASTACCSYGDLTSSLCEPSKHHGPSICTKASAPVSCAPSELSVQVPQGPNRPFTAGSTYHAELQRGGPTAHHQLEGTVGLRSTTSCYSAACRYNPAVP